MKDFLGWAGAVCATMAGCAFLHILVGQKGVGKVFRLLTAAVLVCVTLSPIVRLVKDIRLPTVSTDIFGENAVYDTAVTQMQKMTESLLLAEVNKALASHNLRAEKIEVNMDISEDGNISIKEICLFIPAGNTLHRSWVGQIAEGRLGMAVTVKYMDGG